MIRVRVPASASWSTRPIGPTRVSACSRATMVPERLRQPVSPSVLAVTMIILTELTRLAIKRSGR